MDIISAIIIIIIITIFIIIIIEVKAKIIKICLRGYFGQRYVLKTTSLPVALQVQTAFDPQKPQVPRPKRRQREKLSTK